MPGKFGRCPEIPCRVSLVCMENSMPGRFGRFFKNMPGKFGRVFKNMPGKFGRVFKNMPGRFGSA